MANRGQSWFGLAK